MTAADDPSSTPMGSPLYGRFSRRLQAVLIDWIVILLLIFGAVFIAVTLDSQSLARTLGFSVAAGWLLYEPLLVSLTGSTIGHYVRNLRVVDNRTGGNINFFKAVARTVIKAVLGWLSFITMGTTRRYQAMHDLLTRSTVQIRNPAKASAYHYNSEQTELSSARMPSRVRRLVTIGLYLIAITFIFLVASLALEGMVSPACVNNQYRCSTNEQALLAALSLSWIGACILCIVLGWRGRLIGAQMTRAPS